ncbi:hypothetical protein HD806DRAFT_18352 [Xylariaceae sp. AK1471]|nr:hypothetical protein HD806DRAFT_18352 [Xylariaceae sp. AK1471]
MHDPVPSTSMSTLHFGITSSCLLIVLLYKCTLNIMLLLMLSALAVPLLPRSRVYSRASGIKPHFFSRCPLLPTLNLLRPAVAVFRFHPFPPTACDEVSSDLGSWWVVR